MDDDINQKSNHTIVNPKSLRCQILIITIVDFILLTIYSCNILRILPQLSGLPYFLVTFGIPMFAACSSIYKISLIRSILEVSDQIEQYLKLIISIALFLSGIVPFFWLFAIIFSPTTLNFSTPVLVIDFILTGLCSGALVALTWKIPIRRKKSLSLDTTDNAPNLLEQEYSFKVNRYFSRAAKISNILCFSVLVFGLIAYLITYIFTPRPNAFGLLFFGLLAIPGCLWGTIHAIRAIRKIVALPNNFVKQGIKITLSLPLVFVGGMIAFIFVMMLCAGKLQYSPLDYILIGGVTLMGVVLFPLLVWKIPSRKKKNQNIKI